MKRFHALSSRGQIKIQEMAFVLIAFVIFFALAGLFYLSFKLSDTKGEVQAQRESEAQELVRSISETPELRWSSSNRQCKGCIDLDKAILLKDEERRIFSDLWSMDKLYIEIIYPKKSGECNRIIYPECSTITLINKNTNFKLYSSFVSLCRWDFNLGNEVCYLGKMYASAKEIKEK